MPSINITPAEIANAVPYQVQGLPTPCDMLAIPSEGPKFIPMRITFNDAAAKLVDLAQLGPSQQFSKVSTLYIDNTNSLHDINVLFPDSGFQTRIAFGDTAMVPIVATKAAPRFYVVLDNGGAVDASDFTNIFALNFYVPPALTSIYQRAISYGYAQYFALQPTFTASTSFTATCDYTTFLAGGKLTLIAHKQWYITSLEADAVHTGSSPSTSFMVFYDNGIAFRKRAFTGLIAGGGAGNYIGLVNLGGLNYQSSGNGNLTVGLEGAALNQGDFAFTIGGGVLVT